jgi:uncharacterized protein (TIGR02466 family)
MPNTLDIFKFELYYEKLNHDLNLLTDFCYEQQSKNNGRVLSNLGGWQSNDLDDENKTLSNLKNTIFQHVDWYSKKFNMTKNLKLNNFWININGFKDSNITHFHPNNILSGVFYIKVPEDSGQIKFHNPASDLIESCLTNFVSQYNIINSACWTFEPEENMLLMFPSFLKHSVLPNMNKTDKRISISFNACII